MKRKFKVYMPGGELTLLKIGYLTYSDERIILVEADSLFDVYKKYPNAKKIKEIDGIEILKNSILFKNRNLGYFF